MKGLVFMVLWLLTGFSCNQQNHGEYVVNRTGEKITIDGNNIKIPIPTTNNEWFVSAFEYAIKFQREYQYCWITISSDRKNIVLTCDYYVNN